MERLLLGLASFLIGKQPPSITISIGGQDVKAKVHRKTENGMLHVSYTDPRSGDQRSKYVEPTPEQLRELAQTS